MLYVYNSAIANAFRKMSQAKRQGDFILVMHYNKVISFIRAKEAKHYTRKVA